MNHPRTCLAAAVAVLATGCAEMALSADMGYTDDAMDSAPANDLFREPIRLDVHPVSAPSPNDAPLLAQSFWLDPNDDWTDLRLIMQPTVTVSGTITGFAANPYGADPTVPGSVGEPVLAEVELYQPGTVSVAQVMTDEQGQFTVQVPSGEGYRLVVRPQEAGDLPLTIVDDVSLSINDLGDAIDLNAILEDDLGEPFELDYGDPVFGQITSAGETPVRCAVRLVDIITGEETAQVETNAQGYYFLRAEPGEYTLEVIGSASQAVPTVRRQISFEAGIGGGQFDVDLGTLSPVVIGGKVRSHEGAILGDATVRLTSTMLTNAAGTLVIEDQTNNNGEFLVYAQPGEWTVEVIPFNESQSASSPTEFALSIGDNDLTLPIELPEKVPFQRQVLDIYNQPASNVVISFVQQGFNGATVNTQTDVDGYFTASLPDVPMVAYLTPTNDPDSAITRQELLSPLYDASSTWVLADGAAIDGSVRVAGVSDEAGVFVVDVFDGDEQRYGSIMTTPGEGRSDFSLRIDLAKSP